MLQATFVPVSLWPGKKTDSHARHLSRFDSALSKTFDLLELELRQLGAREILVQTYHSPTDIRNDGWPKSSARAPSSPGVIVSFQSRASQALSFPCDRFRDWESNLRAVALSLEALRKVDRYGVTKTGEQYRGFAALPPASEPDGEGLAWAAKTLSKHSTFAADQILAHEMTFVAARREALKALHPDKAPNAEPGAFDSVSRAGKLLERYFKDAEPRRAA